jgi:hypothetical protein
LRPPTNDRYLVVFPSFITAGQYTGDYDLFAASFHWDGTIEWSPAQPKAISTQKYREFAPVGVDDGSGGIYLAYTVEQVSADNRIDRDILMRHIDRNGQDLWGDSTNHVVAIAQSKYSEQNPRLVLSPDGTIMIFYEVHYDLVGSGGDVDIAAIKIGVDGTKIWTGGIWIAKTKRREHLSGAVTDGRGGGIAVIESSTVDSSRTTASDILAVHANAAGEIGWPDGKPTVVVAGSRHLERNASVVKDGYGGAYIAYELEYTSGERTGDIDVLAQHISSLGVREWVDETAPPIVSSNDRAREEAPSLALDSNSIIVTFQVALLGEKHPLYPIGVQRMSSQGKLLWYEGEKPKLMGVSKRVSEKPQAITDTAGNVFVIFEAHDTVTNDRDIYVQKLGDQGDLLWGGGEDPIPLFNTSDIEHDAMAVPDGDGGLYVAAVREFTSGENAGASNIVVQHIDTAGKLPWEDYRSPLALTNWKMRDGKPLIVRSR